MGKIFWPISPERLATRCAAAALHRLSIQPKVQSIYDSWICTPARLLKQPLKKKTKNASCFSVAIPHWNRADAIHRPLWNIINNEIVQEIIIVDDGSSTQQFEKLQKNILRYDSRKVVKLYRREENKGAQFTKIECVEKTKGDWVVLLDSDNTLFHSYLNAVTLLKHWDANAIYCSDWAFPNFCFHLFAGQEINFQRACHLAQERVLQKISLFNDGNYFFHKKTYLEHFSMFKKIHYDAADVMLMNYYWLSQKKVLKVMRRATYMHRIDPSSFWLSTQQESQDHAKKLFERLEKNLPWDAAFKEKLLSASILK